MKQINTFLILTIIFSSFFLSCATGGEPVQEESPVVVKETEPEPAAEEKPETENIAEAEEKEEVPQILEGPELVKAETDIKELIEKLNKLVSSRNYEAWKEYLSADYIKYYSDPEVLSAMSNSPLLLKNKIVLRTLKDYFNYIVVGSRQNVKLDDIKVIDRDHIKAYMFINDTPVIIYELVRIDNNWKIGKFLE